MQVSPAASVLALLETATWSVSLAKGKSCLLCLLQNRLAHTHSSSPSHTCSTYAYIYGWQRTKDQTEMEETDAGTCTKFIITHNPRRWVCESVCVCVFFSSSPILNANYETICTYVGTYLLEILGKVQRYSNIYVNNGRFLLHSMAIVFPRMWYTVSQSANPPASQHYYYHHLPVSIRTLSD